MSRETRHHASIAEITIQSTEFKDKAVGIVIRRRPFTILVPSHAITALEDGDADRITINDETMQDAEIVAASSLEKAHLSLVRFAGRAPKGLRAIGLPRSASTLQPGQASTLQLPRPQAGEARTGQIQEVKLLGDQATLTTDIPVEPGDSGSPFFVEGRLAGVCMGRTIAESDQSPGTAVIVPLSDASIRELRDVRYHAARTATTIAVSAIVIAFAALAIRSWTTFSLAGMDGPMNSPTTIDAPCTVTATNGQLLTLRRSWQRTFETQIRWWTPFSARTGADFDHMAVGTKAMNGLPGHIYLLDSMGRIKWQYTVPDGECPYDGKDDFNNYGVYTGFGVYRVFTADITGDGHSEVIASFVHHDYYPCKIVVFKLDGTILGEYWHPGFLRTFAVGTVGDDPRPMFILTGSNNRFRGDSPYNPQGLLAFYGADLSGQAPPYTGDAPKGNEAWYYLIQNMDEDHRTSCSQITIEDMNGDGLCEINAELADHRFYILDREGTVLWTDLGDEFLKVFGYVEIPELVWVELGLDAYEPLNAPWAPTHVP